MRIVVLDSTAVCKEGPGSPAFFSRYLIEHLRAAGHDITITNGFYPDLCARADAVWTEWCNEDLLEASQSGVCKKLIGRMRGFDAFGPLAEVEWGNVDHLAYESRFLQQLVEERLPGLRGFRSSVLPSGIDVASIPFKKRDHGPVVAMVGRADAAKGYQLAFEWARQRADIQLHVAIALGATNLRLVRYLEAAKPSNVTLYPGVDTIQWLDSIDANYLLSASLWESLGYTIAEGMALGIKPLMHDVPGAGVNWPDVVPRWRSFADLDRHGPLKYERIYSKAVADFLERAYDSRAYRSFVERNLDAADQSKKFADLLLAPAVPRSTVRAQQNAGALIAQANQAIETDLVQAEQLVTMFRERTRRLGPLDDHRAGLAFRLAAKHAEYGNNDEARVWALRSLGDVVRPDPMCLLGELAEAEDDIEDARRWYQAACSLQEVPSTYRASGLVENRDTRLDELEPDIGFGERPKRYLIVVAVRNAEKYIDRCLESIKLQTRPFLCVVTDDASTDDTGKIAERFQQDDVFEILRRDVRAHSLFNITIAIAGYGQPDDVVVIVDGDDELKPHALEALDTAYSTGAWMTYGNFVTSSGRPSWMPPYPERVLRNGLVRDWPWRVSHPKTFKKALFDKFDHEDAFQHEGKWLQTAGDVALMLPMLEMAAERAFYIPTPIYVYNEENPQADHRTDPDGQVRVRDLIYAKKKYTRLEKL